VGMGLVVLGCNAEGLLRKSLLDDEVRLREDCACMAILVLSPPGHRQDRERTRKSEKNRIDSTKCTKPTIKVS
jgi:hypothetical protein